MSFVSMAAATLFPTPNSPIRWVLSRSPSSAPTAPLNEGDALTITIATINGEAGRALIFKLAGGMSTSFVHSWHDLLEQQCALRGATYQRLSATAYSATLAGRITLSANYDGEPFVLENVSKLDKRTQATNPDGTPGTRSFFLQAELEAGMPGSITGSGAGSYFLDISRTPAGAPTMKVQNFRPDGSFLPAKIPEGTPIVLQITTANTVPGTKMLWYVANKGQSDFVTAFKTKAKESALAAGCDVQTSQATVGPYNGLNIIFTERYSDASPIRVELTLSEDEKTEGTEQVDIIAKLLESGDPANPVITSGMVVSKFIEDTSITPTPSYWQVSARSDGATITYRLFSPTGASEDTVTLSSNDQAPAGFWAALDAAVAATPGITIATSADPNKRLLSSTIGWARNLVWTVPHPAGGGGKHVLKLSAPTGLSRVIVGHACVFLTAPTLPAEPAYLTGINLSGGEHGGGSASRVYITDYRYPSQPEFTSTPPHQEIDYWASEGAQIFRIPFRWAGVQKAPFGPLYPDEPFVGPWDSQARDIHRLDEIVDYITNVKGKWVLLDLHDYLRAFGSLITHGGTSTPEMLIDLWVKIASRYAANPKVHFGLMNEPNGPPAQDVKNIMQWLVNAIRAETGALNRLYVSGTAYTGAWSWVESGNGAAFADFYDPAGNFIFEVHQYLNKSKSGTESTCEVGSGKPTAGGNNYLASFTTWARPLGAKGFVGEIGSGPGTPGDISEQCAIEFPAALEWINTNRDVFGGFTVWVGGRRVSNNDPFKVCPVSYVDPIRKPGAEMLVPFLIN